MSVTSARGNIQANEVRLFLRPAKVRAKDEGGMFISKISGPGEPKYLLGHLYFVGAGQRLGVGEWEFGDFEQHDQIDNYTFASLKEQVKKNFLAAKDLWSDDDKPEITTLGLRK